MLGANLKSTAEHTGPSFAELIRQAVDSWLQHSAQPPREELVRPLRGGKDVV